MDIRNMTEEQLVEMMYWNGYIRYERTTLDNPKMTYEEWQPKEEEKDRNEQIP